MPITFTLAQSATGDADPAAATLAANPTAGNLLLVIGMERFGQSDIANYTIDLTGFTAIGGQATLPSDVNARRSFRVWVKKAAGGAGEKTVSVDDGTTANKRVLYAELTPSEAIDAYTLRGSSHANTGTGSTSPLSSGSTASLAAANYLILTVAIWREQSNDLTSASISWDNTPDVTLDAGTAILSGRAIAVGFKDDAAGGVYEAGVSWGGAGHEGNAAIFALEAETTGGGGVWRASSLCLTGVQ